MDFGSPNFLNTSDLNLLYMFLAGSVGLVGLSSLSKRWEKNGDMDKVEKLHTSITTGLLIATGVGFWVFRKSIL